MSFEFFLASSEERRREIAGPTRSEVATFYEACIDDATMDAEPTHLISRIAFDRTMEHFSGEVDAEWFEEIIEDFDLPPVRNDA